MFTYSCPHHNTAVASTILSVTSNVAPQPGMLGSSHAFQVGPNHILFLTMRISSLTNLSIPFCVLHVVLKAYPCTPLVASSQLHPAGQIHPAQTIPYLGKTIQFVFLENYYD